METTQPTNEGHGLQRAVWAAWFFLAAGSGFLALVASLRIPSQSGAGGIFGLSLARLILASAILAPALVCLGGGLAVLVKKELAIDWSRRLLGWLGKGRRYAALLFLLLFGALFGAFLTLLAPEVEEPFTRAYFERFAPLLGWLSSLCLTSFLGLPVLFSGTGWRAALSAERILARGLLVWGAFLLVWGFIAWSGLGTSYDSLGWNNLGGPLLDYHPLLALLAGIAFLVIGGWLAKNNPGVLSRLDLALCLLAWLGAFLYWWSTPLPESWFLTGPAAPNQEYYPNSDALIYDTTGQSMLTGEGYKSWDQPYPRRPMYALFLAALRVAGRQDYLAAMLVQTAILGLFPVLIYLLASGLHTRLAGVVAATLVILREGSSIAVSGTVTLSHSKLMMSDFPTALGVLLFAWVLVRWVSEPASRLLLPLLGGGVIGVFMLIRPEVAILLGAALVVGTPILYRQPRRLGLGAGLAVLGVALVLAPWVWRNYQMDGSLFLDRPGNRLDFLSGRFEETPGLPLKNGESEDTPVDEPADAPTIQPGEPPEGAIQAEAIAAGGSSAQIIANHFLHSLAQWVEILPVTFRLPESLVGFTAHRSLPRLWEECCSAVGYVRRLPYWNITWDGQLARQSWVPVGVNLFILAIGLCAAWNKRGWAGLAPLAVGLAYIGVTALARTSGGRYILAADWVAVFYFSAGLAQGLLWAARSLAGYRPAAWLEMTTGDRTGKPAGNQKKRLYSGLGLATGLLFLGSLLPMSERLAAQRYDETRRLEMNNAMLASSGEARETLEGFLASGGQVQVGRALYPRFYLAGRGAPGRAQTDVWAGMARPGFYARDFNRTSFYLVGPRNLTVILPAEARPEQFPHAADVIIWGCEGPDYFDALAVGVFRPASEAQTLLWRNQAPESPVCPLPMPDVFE